MATQENIISNRQFIDNDTAERVDKYIDEICENSDFLCKNKELCGTSTSIYTSVENVEKICSDHTESNKCENDIQQCVVSANNTFGEEHLTVSTSFVNIIIPIKNVLDSFGNQKFLRLPPLSGSKSKNSNEICSICSCMDRFAQSPGSGDSDNNTSPGQNRCVYPATFEYYYYPLYIEDINNKLKDAPIIKIGKYKIINSNIIYTNSSEDLSVNNLYDLLIRNQVSDQNAVNFITNVLYSNNPVKSKELQLYILNKTKINIKKETSGVFYKNLISFFIIFIIFVLLIIKVV